MDKVSIFEFWCIGDVSAVKGLNSWEIQVTPREERFAHQELVHSNPQRQSNTIKSNGNDLVVEATSDNSVTATWLGVNSMRKTPPNVRHGSQVRLYKLGDKKYYWTEINTTDEKRLETVVLAISASDSAEMDRMNWSNTYFMSFSSHEKKIHLRMNKVTSEYTGYSLDIDGEDGYAKLNDDLDNAVFIDSRNTIVGFQNQDGTTAYGKKKDLFGYAPQDIFFTAERNITAKCKKFQIDCEDYVCNASSSHKTNTPDAVFSDKITTPLAEIDGIEHATHSHNEQGDGKPVSGPIPG